VGIGKCKNSKKSGKQKMEKAGKKQKKLVSKNRKLEIASFY